MTTKKKAEPDPTRLYARVGPKLGADIDKAVNLENRIRIAEGKDGDVTRSDFFRAALEYYLGGRWPALQRRAEKLGVKP